MTGIVHGIDFGTSTSSIMIGRRGGSIVKVRDPASPQGSFAIPSSICLQKDRSIAVGAAAERSRRTRPESYRSEFKRDFGDPTASRLGDRSYRPDELAAQVIGFLRTQALHQITGEPEQVLVTVPAAWERGNRELMRDAAAAAGYRRGTVRLVTEPAAAAAYAFAGESVEGTTTLVYDLGGGTFDCAVARATATGHKVIGTPGGLGDVGGAEFDRRIMGRIRTAFPEQTAALFDPARRTDTNTLRRRIQLRHTCEALKTQLSVVEAHEEFLSELEPPTEFELSRADLTNLVGPLLEETIVECERLLGALALGWPGVDRVVAVGGSSRLTLVSELLEKRSGRPVVRVDDPELAIVHGATLLAAAEAWPPPPPVTEQPPPPPSAPPPPRPRRFDPARDLFDEDW